MNRTVTIPAQGKREVIQFSYDAPEIRNLHDLVSHAGGEANLVELFLKSIDRDESIKYLESKKFEALLLPKLASQIRVYVDIFTTFNHLSQDEAVLKAVSILTQSDEAPEQYKNLSETEIQSAVELATAPRQKRGRKPKNETAVAAS